MSNPKYNFDQPDDLSSILQLTKDLEGRGTGHGRPHVDTGGGRGTTTEPIAPDDHRDWSGYTDGGTTQVIPPVLPPPPDTGSITWQPIKQPAVAQGDPNLIGLIAILVVGVLLVFGKYYFWAGTALDWIAGAALVILVAMAVIPSVISEG